MAISSDTALFYAVFIAPGFISVMTVISLAAIEDEFSNFALLVWSLVVSLVIDTAFLAVYQRFVTPIQSLGQIPQILFEPAFQPEYVIAILAASFLLGLLGSIVILIDIPGGLRRLLQAKLHISFNPRQPWANFMRDADWVEIKTKDNELYQGRVTEWSRAGRPKQVWVKNPHRYHGTSQEFEPVDSEHPSEMLFLEEDIVRLTMVTRYSLPSLWSRVRFWLGSVVKALRKWAVKRRYSGLLVLGLFGLYVIQLIAAGTLGVDVVEPWFYFTPEPATGWLVAPLSHDMADMGHLRTNLTNLLLVGAFAEPHLSTRKFLKLFAGISAFSVLLPAVVSLVMVSGDWLIAGPSGGIYGLWAFMTVYRVSILRSFWDGTLIEDWVDLRLMGEVVMVVVGLLLIVIVPVNDLFFSTDSVNVAVHLSGLFAGFFLGTLAWRGPHQ